MTDLAIRVANLSKQYRIGQAKQRHNTLRDQLTYGAKSLFSRNGRHHSGVNSVWALKDISFHVEQGDVVGIIGRNGAGKSTLLKILSRITVPTEGRAEIYGRVGSLLEVGTGFHPELSGRENIYLNGAILGMTKKEIDRSFDEIVAFSEIEKFIDTPIKHYSSGMYVRLAFAVAAHLEPEILLVDEVLAVGDAAFQKKCLSKIGAIAGEGRTVVFVSHNMAAVQHLCQRVIVFEDGGIRLDSAPDKAIADYLASFSATMGGTDLGAVSREAGLLPVIRKLDFLDQYERPACVIGTGAPLTVHIHYKHTEPIKDPFFGLVFETATGIKVFWVQTRLQKGSLSDVPASGLVACHIPRLPLVPGTYFVQPGCGSGKVQLDVLPHAFQLQVAEADIFGTGRVPPNSLGLVIVDAEWKVLKENEHATT
jgi:lipopolysaccharide transport system ATP-binding protein